MFIACQEAALPLGYISKSGILICNEKKVYHRDGVILLSVCQRFVLLV